MNGSLLSPGAWISKPMLCVSAGISVILWRVLDLRRQRTTGKGVLEAKRAKIKAKIKAYEDKYPFLTQCQTDIIRLDFQELRLRLQAGSLKATEVLDAFMAKAVEVNKKTNAIAEFIDESLTRARELDLLGRDARGPLHGIPISLKELVMIKDYDCTVGIVSNIGKPVDRDAEIVGVLKDLGAVPFCRTNLSQTCISFDCCNPIYGITRNYLNPDRSPGGSSGGEGALIAGGGSVMGIGSDLGGSVRIPAAFSGITSLRPTAGRIPLQGQGSDGGIQGLCVTKNTLGLMARSAESIKECLSLMLRDSVVNQITSDPRFVPMPWRDSISSDDRPLRIGWYNYDGCFQATPGYHRAIKVAIEALRSRGHEVVQFTPPNLEQVCETWAQACNGDEGVGTMRLLDKGPVDMQALAIVYWILRLPFWLRKLLAPILGLKSPKLAASFVASANSRHTWQLWEVMAKKDELKETILRAMEVNQIDILLSPGFGVPALPLGYPAFIRSSGTYTVAYNVLDFPAGSVPVTKETDCDQEELESYPGFETDLQYGWAKEGTRGAVGMPLNVQLIGRPWTEELVLRAMMDLEKGLVIE